MRSAAAEQSPLKSFDGRACMSVNRTLPAPPRAPDERTNESTAAHLGEYLPSWLTSLVAHLVLVLLLASLVINDAAWKSDAIALDFETGSEGQTDEFDPLEDAIELPTTLASEQLEEPTNQMAEVLEPDVIEPVEIKLADLPQGAVLAGTDLGENDQQSGTAGGAAVNPARTEVFGLTAEGERFVYVFDRSESMMSELTYSSEGTPVLSVTPLAAAKAELLRSLDDLDAGHEFGIVFYNHSPWLFTLGRRAQSLLPATSKNKNRAASFVGTVYGQGKTNHVKPLEIALRMKPDVIFLLTDGETKDDLTSSELRSLRRLNDGRARINVIQFCYRPRSGGALVQLAEENGGQHVFYNIRQLGREMLDRHKQAAAR